MPSGHVSDLINIFSDDFLFVPFVSRDILLVAQRPGLKKAN